MVPGIETRKRKSKRFKAVHRSRFVIVVILGSHSELRMLTLEIRPVRLWIFSELTWPFSGFWKGIG